MNGEGDGWRYASGWRGLAVVGLVMGAFLAIALAVML